MVRRWRQAGSSFGSSARLLAALSVLAISAALLPDVQAQGGAAPKAATPAYAAEPKFTAAMAEGKQLSVRHMFGFAADAYKKANKLAGGQCAECLLAGYQAELSAGQYKEAAALAASMEALAATPLAKSLAESRRGSAMLWQAGEKPKPQQLEAVHVVLQQAITDYPKNVGALYTDGQVLARLGKTEEARQDFEQCVSCASPTDPARLRARHFAENPELSLHKMAPAFEVTALDGKRFNLDAMDGRVVLIDFWATWCGPCNTELPHLRKIAQEFAGQPLVIISVSWDADEAKWKNFIASNGMTWIQYRDVDHKLSTAFGVEAIPHYFTIDSDGVLTAEMLGSGSDVEGKLKKLLKRAGESRREAAEVANTNSGSPAVNAP